ncbi:acyl-CoA N-acyltransferase [Lipomyces oligophaga]|uniref:acyl-CoA N-acyltransferase n=1 Tax=Lipomyces oligophaga TaxID=45792 RepID=UPI0034CECB94
MRIELDDLTANNLGVLRKINSVVLPTKYSDAWYKESLTVGELAKLAYFNEIPVGAIRCALETKNDQKTKIYIMTVAVLAPYRGYGIGRRLIDHIIEYAKTVFVKEVYCHVWTRNDEALQWYLKLGFEKGVLVKEYYKKMDPPEDAYLLRLRIQ